MPTFGFVLNDSATDVSVMSAGGNIIYSGMQIGGPGQLVVEAGGNYYAANQASLTSLAPFTTLTQTTAATVPASQFWQD